MAERYLSKAALESHHGLEGLKLASPRRRLASLRMLGIGLFDFWRNRNRRLAHDRIAQTVVVHRARRV